MNEQSRVYPRYWRWRYSVGDDPGDQLQKAIQAYIKVYGERPLRVLIPKGLNLLTPMSGLEVQQNKLVPPCRFYFAIPQPKEGAENMTSV
jgi:hypothetical protein